MWKPNTCHSDARITVIVNRTQDHLQTPTELNRRQKCWGSSGPNGGSSERQRRGAEAAAQQPSGGGAAAEGRGQGGGRPKANFDMLLSNVPPAVLDFSLKG